jgi:cytochrome oxidase Cu insertion factor (SCO1/SenC/PrrC family)
MVMFPRSFHPGLQSMRKIILFLSFVCVAFQFSAQVFTIKGTAKSYAGSKIVLFTTSDFVSGERKALAIAQIDDAGNFSISETIEQTMAMDMAINNVECKLYVEPGHHYQIDIPSFEDAQLRRFDKTPVDITFQNLPEDDLNNILASFNTDFYTFLNDHYYDFAVGDFQSSDVVRSKLGSHGKKTDIIPTTAKDSITVVSNFGNLVTEFFNTMNFKYGPYYKNLFFKDYAQYALAEIELVAGKSRKLFYREYFHQKPILFQNPSYMRTFDIFYNKFLINHAADKQKAIDKTINLEESIFNLLEYLKSDSLALDEKVRTLAVLENLKDSYYTKIFSSNAILRSVIKFSEKSTDIPFKNITDNLVKSFTKNKEFWTSEDFTLIDLQNEKWTLNDHLGWPIYIFFFTSWSPNSQKELLMLQKLNETYGKDIQIVAISMDNTAEIYLKYIESHRDQKFTFLYGPTDPLLREKFNLRAVPYAIMLDAEGKVMYNYTKRPSEGVQADFEKIKQQAKQSGQGGKSWNKK